ncbi:transient receptor potential cation channel subfamily M member 2-like [Paramacrobiotus metropolitanus]|uniref:transient receptor potential cation channel subfamily M member 2-like n=1 Tax=Paramacrobiotus metropolitanus TaxID=2943436 RepID=UPI00244587B2|nr:transient receptor potential cation channel subfamily M member 2-like [Paramacrobiotus metropolitanus]
MDPTDSQVYLKISSEAEIPDAVADIINGWNIGSPDIILSVLTGHESSYLWRQAVHRAAFQKSIIKLTNSGSTLVIDDGLNHGLSAVISAAIRDEQFYNSEFATKDRPATITRLIGMVPTSIVGTNKRSGNNEPGYGLDNNHTHFVLLNEPRSHAYGFRVQVERELRTQLGRLGHKSHAAHQLPVIEIVMFVQGGIEELEQVESYLNEDVQVMLLQGCNGTADVLAGSIEHWNGSLDEAFYNNVDYLIDRVMFAQTKPTDKERRHIAETIADIISLSQASGLLKVINAQEKESISGMDAGILRSAMERCPKVSEPFVLERNWLLAVQNNQIELATDILLAQYPWSAMEIPYAALMEALVLPGREAFVDIMLQQMPVRHFLSHMDYLMLYQNTLDDEFFVERVWDQVLQHHANDPITEAFLYTELNPVIYKLSGIKDYINLREMSTNALGLSTADATSQDRTALNALIVYATLFNRVELIKILLKFSIDPVPQAIFVALLFRSLAGHNPETDVHAELVQNSIDFDNLATDLFNLGYNDFPERCHGLLSRKLPEFNNLTTLEMSYKGFCLKFLSHPAIQQFVEDFAFGFVRYRGSYGYLKMLISAFTVCPMYKWLTFPMLTDRQAAVDLDKIHDEMKEPTDEEDIKRYITNLRHNRQPDTVTRLQQPRAQHPPVWQMTQAVWQSPVVKYWIWFITYHLFLILIGVDIMLPPCMYVGVDIAVFACTALIWLDLVLKTLKDYLYGAEMSLTYRGIHFFYQTAWNILFFLYRIEPFRETQPFSGRIILAFGVLYYYYIVWDLFLYFPHLTASVVRLLKKNMLVDLFRWIILMLPLLLATGVVWQAITTPDWPFTGDDWRHAFYRSIFTLFGGFFYELDYDPTCEAQNKIDWKNFTQPDSAVPHDRCWLGDYNSYSCQTVSVWSYIFVIHYYFLLKLAMLTVLNAYYLHTNMRLAPLADLLCRYKRFQTIMNYAQRSALPWPFSVFGYLIQIVTFKKSKRTRLIKAEDAQKFVTGVDLEAFTYWRAKAMQFFAQKDREGASDTAFEGHRDKLRNVQNLVASLHSKIGFLDSKLRK